MAKGGPRTERTLPATKITVGPDSSKECVAIMLTAKDEKVAALLSSRKSVNDLIRWLRESRDFIWPKPPRMDGPA